MSASDSMNSFPVVQHKGYGFDSQGACILIKHIKSWIHCCLLEIKVLGKWIHVNICLQLTLVFSWMMMLPHSWMDLLPWCAALMNSQVGLNYYMSETCRRDSSRIPHSILQSLATFPDEGKSSLFLTPTQREIEDPSPETSTFEFNTPGAS